jgi:gluconokinase
MVHDRYGRAVPGASAREPYEIRTTADGGSELDAEVLLDRSALCIDRAVQSLGPQSHRVGAVAVDTFVTNLLGLDRDGRPLTPVYTYADTRSSADAAVMRSQFDEQEIHERTGTFLRSSYWPARFAWFRRVQPRLCEQVNRWISI